jgi:hypothetical protein
MTPQDANQADICEKKPRTMAGLFIITEYQWLITIWLVPKFFDVRQCDLVQFVNLIWS